MDKRPGSERSEDYSNITSDNRAIDWINSKFERLDLRRALNAFAFHTHPDRLLEGRKVKNISHLCGPGIRLVLYTRMSSSSREEGR